MPKVTFDGPNKLININNGETKINVRTDIYSAWKVWVTESDNSKYEQALRVVGGDPTIGINTITAYFFLMNGWKVRPYEGNHTLEIDGILIVDGGGDPFQDTIGDWRIAIQAIVPLKAETIIIDNTVEADTDAPIWDGNPGVSNAYQAGNRITIAWNAATDPSGVAYRVYIAKSDANLFSLSNLHGEYNGSVVSISSEADGVTEFESGNYYIGVRAIDSVGNETTNTNNIIVNYTPAQAGDALTASDISAISSAVWSETTRELTGVQDSNIVSVDGISVSSPDDFKADLTTIETDIADVQTKLDNVDVITQAIYDYTFGRWAIDKANNQMVIYEPDNVTELARFDLKDENGNPTYSAATFDRVRV
jgi:hypothetical protein